MLVRMKTTYAGPKGCLNAAWVYKVPEALGRSLTTPFKGKSKRKDDDGKTREIDVTREPAADELKPGDIKKGMKVHEFIVK